MKPNISAIVGAINKVLFFGGMDTYKIPVAEKKSGRSYPSSCLVIPVKFDTKMRRTVLKKKPYHGRFFRPVKHQDRSKYTGAMVRKFQSERGCGRPVR